MNKLRCAVGGFNCTYIVGISKTLKYKNKGKYKKRSMSILLKDQKDGSFKIYCGG
jgi:hypothetical protein